jgi:hypothetical protein
LTGPLNHFFANREWFGYQASKLAPLLPRADAATDLAASPSLDGGLAVRRRRWCRRELAMAGALGAAAAILLAGAVASVLFGVHWRQAADDLEEAVAAKEEQRNLAVAAAAKLTDALAAKEEQHVRAVEAAENLRQEERKSKQMVARLFVQLGVQACANGDIQLGMLQLARGLETAPDDENVQELARINLAAWRRMASMPREPLVQLERVVAWSSDGRRALVRGADETVKLHDTRAGKPCGEPVPYTAKDTRIVLSPNGRTVLIAHEGKSAALSHSGAVTWIGFRGDGRIAVTEAARLVGQNDGPRSLWDAETGRSQGIQKQPSSGIVEIASSPDGRTLLMSETGLRTLAWGMEAATGNAIGKLLMKHDGVVTAGLFSPDSQRVLTVGSRFGGGEEARLWQVATGAPTGRPLQHAGRIRAMAFSADGKTVLTGSDDGTAQLWAADTGEPLGPPLQHSGPVLAVAISADSKMIATGCADQAARLWHLPTKKPLGPPFLHPAAVSFVVFGHDGRALTTRSNDDAVRVWDLPAPMDGTIDRIRLWAQVSTGMELDGEATRRLDDKELAGRRKQLQGAGGPPR